MDDLQNIFSNLKLNSDNSSGNEDADKYFEEIDIALKKNETTSKWMDELEKENGPVTAEELNRMLDISKKNQDFANSQESGALIYSVVETIAIRCLLAEIKIQRNEFQEASTDAIAIVKFINKHKAYYAKKEYMVGFRYVANCLAIKARIHEIRNKNQVKEVRVSRLKLLLKSLNEYQNFGIPHRVGVLTIKHYFAGNLRKCSHNFQLRIIRDVSNHKNHFNL